MTKQNDIRPAPELAVTDDTVIEAIDLAETEVIVDGERLTDERADEIAADVLARARAHNAGLIPGGKSLSGGTKHSPVVQVRVSEATRDRLQEIAAARHMSVSKLSRQVLDEFVAAAGGQ
jgi:fructose-bisphosphate aldolase class 1